MIRAALLAAVVPPLFAQSFDSLKQYSALNAELSAPVPQPYATPYFTDNERAAENFYPRFEGIGGVMIGTGFQQNFTFLIHGRPDLYVFFDINPDVTEILVPFFGRLIAESPTRRDFLSTLTGAPFTPNDVRRLLHPSRPSWEIPEALGSSLPAVVGGILDRVPKEQRRRNFEERMNRLLVQRKLSAEHRAQIMNWFGLIEEDMLTGGKFFEQSAQASWIAGNDRAKRNQLAGWLSTEETYSAVRRAWIEGRVIGVTGDIAGPSIAKLARWLQQTRKPQVTVLYLSNIGASIMGHQTPAYFAQLYQTLGQLPLSPNAVTLIAQGNNIAYLRTYARAKSFYDSLQHLNTGMLVRLVEFPLSYSVQGSAADALRKFKQESGAFTGNQAAYAALLDSIIANSDQIRGLSTTAFEDWASKRWPALDTSTDVFVALSALLTDLGILKP